MAAAGLDRKVAADPAHSSYAHVSLEDKKLALDKLGGPFDGQA